MTNEKKYKISYKTIYDKFKGQLEIGKTEECLYIEI